jgi:RNA polymerase sigma factor (sigma-70 family)
MDLVEAAREGREAAYLQLFDEHHLPLFRFAYRVTGSVADAEDLVQECFLELLRPQCRYEPGRTSVRTYLFGVARNQFLKRLRKMSKPAQKARNTERTRTISLIQKGCVGGPVVAKETILGYATVAIRHLDHNQRMTSWMAPELGCFALRLTEEERRPDGSFRLVLRKQALSVNLVPKPMGSPDSFPQKSG